MRRILSACAFVGAIFAMPQAEASVQIDIDLSSQTMHVSSDSGSYDWPISTARSTIFGSPNVQTTRPCRRILSSPTGQVKRSQGAFALTSTPTASSIPRVGKLAGPASSPSDPISCRTCAMEESGDWNGRGVPSRP